MAIAYKTVTKFLPCSIFQRKQYQEVFNGKNTHVVTLQSSSSQEGWPPSSSSRIPWTALLKCKFLDLHLDLQNQISGVMAQSV